MASCKIGCHGASPTVPVPNRICKVGLVPALNPAEGSSENSNYRHRHILHDLVLASFQVFCILACLHSTTASQQRLLWSCLEGQNPQHFSHPVCFSWIFFFSSLLELCTSWELLSVKKAFWTTKGQVYEVLRLSFLEWMRQAALCRLCFQIWMAPMVSCLLSWCNKDIKVGFRQRLL